MKSGRIGDGNRGAFSFLRNLARIGLVFLITASAEGADNSVVALKAARMFDGKSNALVQNGVVVVQGGKILDVGANAAIPEGAQVIDLGDATIAPGFIDAHTHLTSDYSQAYNDRRLKDLETELPLAAYQAIPFAERTLMAGFTTVRDLGSQAFMDVALRDAIAKGIVRGPHILAAT